MVTAAPVSDDNKMRRRALPIVVPNLSLYQFGMPDLRYERYFGVRDDNHILGWVGIMTDREKWMYTPAVAVHANWRSEGDRVLVTLLVPRPGAPERVREVADKSGTGVSGFDVVLPDGRPMSYRATTKLALLNAQGLKAEANSLLAIHHADGSLSGIALGCHIFNGKPSPPTDFEFTMPSLTQSPQTTPISAPTGFSWSGSGKDLAPGYIAPKK